MNVGGVLLLRFIGSLDQSAEAQAAYAVGYGQLFSLITWTSVGLMGATAAIVGQNIGAKQPERAIAAVHGAARIGLSAAAVLAVLFVAIPRVLLGGFGMTDPAAVAIGVRLLQFLSVSGFFVTTALTYTGGLQGAADTKSPFYISVVAQIILPLSLLAVLGTFHKLEPTDIWIAIVIGHATRCTLSVLRFRQSRWRSIAVDLTTR